MNPLIPELFDLSENAALFHHLQDGGDVQSLPLFPQESRTRRGYLLQRYEAVIKAALQTNDLSTLKTLLESCPLNDQIVIVGEMVLTLHALEAGNHTGDVVEKLRGGAFELVNQLCGVIEQQKPQDTEDTELQAHGVALREWAHLFAEHYERLGVMDFRAQLLLVRARVTNATLTYWPNLVGDAMVTAGRAIEAIGQTEMPANIYNGVRMDLDYAVERIDDPKLPRYETQAALYWLQQACEEFARLNPDDAEATTQLQAARELREQRGFPAIPSAPRIGPIAHTYLDRIPWLARVLKDLQAAEADTEEERIAAICQRHGCYSFEVEFFQSAIGSYFSARPMLESMGSQTSYDEDHQEVFAALEYNQTNES